MIAKMLTTESNKFFRRLAIHNVLMLMQNLSKQ